MTGGIELNKSDLAKMAGVNITTVSQWVVKGCPYVQSGNKSKPWIFNSAQVMEWRREQAAMQAIGDTAGLDMDEARRRKLAAEAALVELDLSVRKGEVAEIAIVAAAIGEDYANLRAKLLSIPTKMAPTLVGVEDLQDVKARLDDAIVDALEELTADGVYAVESDAEGDSTAEEGKPQAAA